MTYDDIKIKINGIEIPPPVDISTELSDEDVDSGRNIKDGVMYRNRVRDDVHKISLTYDMDNPSDISKLLQLVNPKEFLVEIFDLKTMKRVSKEFYAGNKSYSYICAGHVWIKGFKVSLIER